LKLSNQCGFNAATRNHCSLIGLTDNLSFKDPQLLLLPTPI
jgi:hypothetical protein